MYYCVTGKLIYTEPQFAVVSCGGVGYKCYTTLTTQNMLPAIGQEVTLYTHLNGREDVLDLYGFYTLEECRAFRQLTGVSGVGPKSAIAILSDMTPDQLALCIAAGDAKTLSRAPGIGPKAAQRLILELRDKMADQQFTQSPVGQAAAQAAENNSSIGEAVGALCALGYSQTEAVRALAGAPKDIPTGELVKYGLKRMGSGKK